MPESAKSDPLVQALVRLAARFSLRTDARAIVHGMPLVQGRLPVEHLGEAASRAGLSLSPCAKSARELRRQDCPLLCVDAQDGAVFLITAIEEPGKGKARATIEDSDGQRRDILLSEALARRPVLYTASPRESADARTRELPVPRQPHWLWGALKINAGIYGHVLAATFIVNLLALAIPLVTMNVYNRVLANAAFTTLWSLVAGGALAALFDLVLRTLRAVMIDRAAARSDVLLANRIFARLLGARLQGRNASVGVQANSLREFESLREFFNSATIAALGDLPFIALFLLVIATIAGPLVWVPLSAIPVVLLIGWITQHRLNRLIAEIFTGQAHKNAVIIESLSGLETLKAQAAESWAAAKWEQATAEHLRHSLKSRLVMALSSHLIAFTSALTTFAILVYGVYLVTDGVITPGAMFAAMILNGRIMAPLAQLAGLLSRLHQARMAFAALKQIVELPQERPEGASFVHKNAIEGRIAFQNVRFAYEPDAADALRGVSLDIAPGEKVGIVGGMGSGKSTMLKLALGLLRPADGRILVDGLPVSQIDPACLRSAMGALLQDAMLFHGPIRANVTLGRPGIGDQELLRALEISGAMNWIRHLPQGLDTVIGERGAGLSGGQKQSLCLARALLGDPPILLLDEPTSQMDGQMEKAFSARLRAAMPRQTLLLVTHKPALLSLVDRLVVLEHGRVLLDGPREQTLEELRAITARRRKENAA